MSCWGCGALEGAAGKFKTCARCRETGLVPCKFCSNECLAANWPRHRAWHKTQEQEQGQVDMQTQHSATSSAQKAQHANELTLSDSPYLVKLGKGRKLVEQNNYSKAVKEFRKAIAMEPERGEAYGDVALAYARSGEDVRALEHYLICIDRVCSGSEFWGSVVSSAFSLFMDPRCEKVPKPAWWNTNDLKQLSKEVVAADPGRPTSWVMRGRVLMGSQGKWVDSDSAEPTREDFREAGRSYQRAAENIAVPSFKEATLHNARCAFQQADLLDLREKLGDARVTARLEKLRETRRNLEKPGET